jgi:hypothetical protein
VSLKKLGLYYRHAYYEKFTLDQIHFNKPLLRGFLSFGSSRLRSCALRFHFVLCRSVGFIPLLRKAQSVVTRTRRTWTFFPELIGKNRPGPYHAMRAGRRRVERIAYRTTEKDRGSDGDVSAGVSHGGLGF